MIPVPSSCAWFERTVIGKMSTLPVEVVQMVAVLVQVEDSLKGCESFHPSLKTETVAGGMKCGCGAIDL